MIEYRINAASLDKTSLVESIEGHVPISHASKMLDSGFHLEPIGVFPVAYHLTGKWEVNFSNLTNELVYRQM